MNTESKQLLMSIQSLIRSARHIATRGVNALQVMTNFEIGCLIVEHEQKGKKRAEYGKKMLQELSKELSSEFGRGFSRSNLEYMRRFFLEYRERIPKIPQTVSGKLPEYIQKNQMLPKELSSWQIESSDSKTPFRLSWSQYVFLLEIPNGTERQFYEIEAAENNWSLRELKRQYDSGLYERLALSRDKKKIKELSVKGQLVDKPEDILKEPYVLEFLGIDEKAAYSEYDLESAIIDKLEHFLLELGKGFLFEARQKRLSCDADHFFVDLVFYNRILRCYVVIDLKIGRLTHQDLGQMQMYVNYFDRFVRSTDENPTIGIILCSMKNDALVKLTLPKDTRVYPARYQLYVPSKKTLRQKLLEWMREPVTKG
jgi:predicted nuclease of restriction endonuclease-like (RecB) superfamily